MLMVITEQSKCNVTAVIFYSLFHRLKKEASKCLVAGTYSAVPVTKNAIVTS